MSFVNGSLCYLFRGEQVLMLKRANPPHVGKWTAPGGKMELGESPDECVIREIQEETGFSVKNPVLRGIATVTDIYYPIYWQLFIFTAHEFESGTPLHDEGELAWLPVKDLDHYEIPRVDRLYLPFLLYSHENLFRVKVVYNTPDVCVSEKIY